MSFKITASAERRPCTGKDEHPRFIIVRYIINCIANLVTNPIAESILLFRSI